MIFSSVDLPAPFSPTSASDSPRRTVKSMSASATKPSVAGRASGNRASAATPARGADARVDLADVVDAEQDFTHR